MPWVKTAAERQAEDAFYNDPVYKRNRRAVARRAGGRCEECGHRHARLQCDHIIPRSQGGGHATGNLRMLCAGSGTCKCHEAKTAQEGGGFRASRGNQPAHDPKPRPRTNW
jgi:5-methylcytosine-specific restriction endonuclease McrA